MKRPRVRWLIGLVGVAVLVEALGTVGWWRWNSTVDELARDAESGAQRIAGSVFFALPSTLMWARQLAPRDLIEASDDTVVRALRRLGETQLRWTVTEYYGPTNLARASLIEGKIEEAREHLDDALLRHPTSPYLHRLVALVLRATGHANESLDHLAQAEALSPGFRSPPMDLVPEDQQWVRLEGLERRLELYPRQRISGLINLARVMRANGQDSEARNLLAEETANPVVVLEIAGWDLRDLRLEEAADAAGNIARRASYPLRLRVPAWSLLAQARDHMGDVEGARSAAQEALRLAPDSASPYLTLASLAERRQDYEIAFGYLRTARGIDPTNVNLLIRLGRTAEKIGEHDDAKSAYERAADIDSSRSSTTSILVDYLLRRGELMDAALLLSRAMDRFPTDARLLSQAEELRRRATGR